MSYIKNPFEIEKKSFEIIESEMGNHSFNEDELLIVKRVIHTTADFEYKDLVEISKNAIEIGRKALRNGAKIYADTNMSINGFNKRAMKAMNCEANCYVALDRVFDIAKKRNITRSMAAVELAAEENVDIFVFGNAPTALFKLRELITEGKAKPKLIIAVPVGFVGAAESKIGLEELGIPFIRVNGRKGGSTVSAAIINALLYMDYNREENY